MLRIISLLYSSDFNKIVAQACAIDLHF